VSGAAALILSTGYQSATALRATILDNVDVLGQLNGLVQTSGRLNIGNALLLRSTPPTTTTMANVADGCVTDPTAIGLQCQVARVGMALSALACSPNVTRGLARRMARIRRLSDRLNTAASVLARQIETRLARRVAALARALDRAARHRGCQTAAAAQAVETLGNQLRAFREAPAPQ
jgi:hypothetical protein